MSKKNKDIKFVNYEMIIKSMLEEINSDGITFENIKLENEKIRNNIINIQNLKNKK